VDRREELAMLGFGDPAAAPYVSGIPEHELDASWQLILPTGERLMEGRAAIAALEAVAVTRWLGRLLRILRMGALVDLAYRGVARSRGYFGRFVPDRAGPRRAP
jgi:predicted DCC family thiol-disulfide oxidoreductase YuxK